MIFQLHKVLNAVRAMTENYSLYKKKTEIQNSVCPTQITSGVDTIFCTMFPSLSESIFQSDYPTEKKSNFVLLKGG